jgi:hypothetical protein
LDDRYRESMPGRRFFTLIAVAEEYGISASMISAELVRRREVRESRRR